MAILVTGKLILKPDSRNEFIEKSIPAILLARQNSACEDFSVSADPVDENRVNIFEKWTSKNALEVFRNTGPESDVFSLVEVFNIDEYEVT
ncbi:putative quinol monooxygenase [Thalassotalea profundi]|uniref:ABM domain-containing protein n=1 Tax=Thalassotalea profundi TaxID=2036687 RepID=A0ABQ3J188_9GAMM|nr:antibiotic biosynthesis monooxygenase [Thalassotalea profundi]GHE95640.1 hypothetical protein GCM10011501_26460 [Thalassotalea profundi]